jgi:hypothetical protein
LEEINGGAHLPFMTETIEGGWSAPHSVRKPDMGQTLYDKLWDSHVIHVEEDGTTLLYVDRQLMHELSTPQAFEGLRHQFWCSQVGSRIAKPQLVARGFAHATLRLEPSSAGPSL